MRYTKQQLNIISTAMLDTSNYTTAALHMLNDFSEKYLESKEGVNALIFMLENDYERISFEIFAITQLLSTAKNELDLYVGIDSHSLEFFFESTKEKFEIYKTNHNKAV